MSFKIVILGAGASGIAARKLGEALGYSCRIVRDDDDLALPDGDLVVASPGVPPLKSNLYKQAENSGIELIGEMEFAFRHFDAPLLAVTGTNGKTTTTELLLHLLKKSGVDAVAAGNIGRPLSDVAADALTTGKKPEAVALEVSNFQLEKAPTFAPFAAALLNLASDHEDRYADGFAGYRRAKMHIFDRVPEARRVYGLSFAGAPRRIAFRDGVFFDGENRLFDAVRSTLASPHNAENLAAALELARIYLGRYPELPGSLEDFSVGAHRFRKVADKCGRIFIDDSKATNPHAVFAALNAADRPVVLLLGGKDKGMDFSGFSRLSPPAVRAVVLFGECREKIRASLPGGIPVFDGEMDFARTVRLAAHASRSGDAILLSPACASFDLFKSYGDRGDRFKEIADALKESDFTDTKESA